MLDNFNVVLYIYYMKTTDMKNLLISGSSMCEWNIDYILGHDTPKYTKDMDICRMLQYDWDNKIGPHCEGMTYLEIEQFNNTYNNF